jgi:hypothetical protein
MKVRAIFESGVTRVVLIAEGEAEMLMLGVLGGEMVATAQVRHEGHYSHAKRRMTRSPHGPPARPALSRPALPAIHR